MPVLDISAVNSQVIGVCCVQGEERDLLKQMWDQRFSEHTAFFADISMDDSSMRIVKKIFRQIESSGLTSLAGMNVVLAIFLDLTQEIKPELLEALAGVPGKLTHALGCMVQVHYSFGFLGSKSDYDEKQITNRVKETVRSDGFSKGLILVAEPSFGGRAENRWKAVMLYLDMLRRGANVNAASGVSHFDGTVGFLRYGEFDENLREKLQAEQQALERNLTDEGSLSFGTKVSTSLGELDIAASELFRVNVAMQPLHPNMAVNGTVNKMKAAANKNDDFNKARAASADAAVETGKRLEEQVLAYFKEKIGEPKEYLIQLFKDVGAGIGFVENRAKVNEVLEKKLQSVTDPAMPNLAYHKDGEPVYRQELSNYFTQKLHYAVFNAKKWAMDALAAAYKDMSDDAFRKKRKEMQKRLEVVLIQQNHVPSKQTFCNIAIGNGLGLESQFFTFAGDAHDVTLKYVVCREEKDSAFLNDCSVVGMECRYYINSVTGSLVDLDSAPIKAVQAALFNCTDDRLEELLCEE